MVRRVLRFDANMTPWISDQVVPRQTRCEDAAVLVDAAETLRDRSSPSGQPHAFTVRVWASALLIDALAATLNPAEPDGVLTRSHPDTYRFTAPRWGEVVFRRSANSLEAHVEIVGEEPVELICGSR
ncbi:MAG: hypothetical protein JST54_28300 [Deltaproteobacteria bacterium]|nr:hypothetical protein [Deltaproteobacteria bacterium]